MLRHVRLWVRTPTNGCGTRSVSMWVKKAQLPCWIFYSQQVSHQRWIWGSLQVRNHASFENQESPHHKSTTYVIQKNESNTESTNITDHFGEKVGDSRRFVVWYWWEGEFFHQMKSNLFFESEKSLEHKNPAALWNRRPTNWPPKSGPAALL